MLVAHSMPAITGTTLTAGSWLTADGAAALFDGKPARRARLQLGAGSYTGIRVTFAATAVRCVALLGLVGVAAGVTVEVLGRVGAGGFTTPLGGNAATGVTRLQADGTTAAWILGDTSGTQYTGLEVRIHAASAAVDIGELVAMPVLTLPIRDGWTIQPVDPTQYERTLAMQRVGVARRPYRVLSAEVAGQSTDAVRRGGLSGGMDLATLATALAGNARACFIPDYRDMTTKAMDYQLAAASAIYGAAVELPGAANLQRQWYGSRIVAEEVPA